MSITVNVFQAAVPALNIPESATAAATINILSRSVTQVAPEEFNFDVSVTGFDATGPTGGDLYDDRLHELYYHWDFDDAYTFAAPQQLRSGHDNAGVSFGHAVSHTVRAPKTCSPTVRVYGRVAGVWEYVDATITITVGDPDTLFAGAATFFVDPDSDFSVAPSGAATYTSLATAMAAVVSAGASNPRRVVLNRGKTFPVTGQIWPIATPSFQVVAGSGGGAKPLIDWTPSGATALFYMGNIDVRVDADPSKSIAFQNIQFQGDADITNTTGTLGTYFFQFGRYPPSTFLLDQCELRNIPLSIWDIGHSSGLEEGGQCFKTVNDCVFENWLAACFFGECAAVTAFVGTRMQQDPDAITGFDGSTLSIIAPIRISRANHFIMDACDGFSSTGWSGTPDPNYKAIQPVLRFNSASEPGAKLNMVRTVSEAGFQCLDLADANNADSTTVNAIVHMSTFLSNFMGWWFVGQSHSGVTMRNNIFIRPDVPSICGNDPWHVVRQFFLGSTSNEAYNAPNQYYSNSLINLLSTANYNDTVTAMAWEDLYSGTGGVDLNDMTFANNINHQPNITSPENSFAPLSTTQLFTPRYNGYLGVAVTPKDTSVATPAGDVIEGRPLTGSSAIDGYVSGPVALDDIDGIIRDQTAIDIGPFKVS